MLDPAGNIISWSDGAEAITGYTRQQILGRHFSLFLPMEAVAAGAPELELKLATASGRYEVEALRVRSNGSCFMAHVVMTPIHDASGQLCGFTKVVKDVSRRRHWEERFRRVVEFAPNAMVMINSAGCIDMLNHQAERLFGYQRSELLGQPVEILVPERFRAHHPEKRMAFAADPQARPMGAGRDLYGRRKDGSEFPVEIGLNPIETGDGVMVLSAIVDISDRKQKEERIQAALKEKDLLLGEIHHRVKNNLQIVHSLLDLQASRIDDSQIQDMLKDTQNRVRSMALIHQTLYQSNDFAKVDFRAFLDALLPTLIDSCRLDGLHITLEVAVDHKFLPINSAVPCGLLVNELVTNALKHGFQQRQHGQISVSLLAHTPGWLQLEVCDDGCGIPADIDIEQLDTLGLSLVQLISQQLMGQLQISRADPTRFTLQFPQEGA